MFRTRADGQPYASLGNLADAPEGRGLLFAMNGGMYQTDLSPVGLYVEKGRELKKANTAAGPGNFHMKPNGVFYVGDTRAGVVETGRYLRERPRALFATQSGPMLVIDGRIHPRISEEGPSQKRRNGVGMRDANTLVFAISDQPVSFGTFARLFKNELGCANALFLDGSVSSLYAPSAGRRDTFFPVGPIVAAFPK
jgi:prepilin-type processing-associated H-X9-DG protein